MSSTAVYVRVSSKRQNTASQEGDLGRWAVGEAAAGAELVWYRDQWTGRSMDRPGWSELWSRVQLGAYRRIVVWRLDRLGRTARGLCELFEDLVRLHVDLVSLRDGFTLDSPSGRLHARILASVAEFELEVRSERQLAGIEAARERGQTFGRRPKSAGGAGTRIKVTGEQAELVVRLKAEGSTVAAISRATGLSRPTVYGLLAGA